MNSTQPTAIVRSEDCFAETRQLIVQLDAKIWETRGKISAKERKHCIKRLLLMVNPHCVDCGVRLDDYDSSVFGSQTQASVCNDQLWCQKCVQRVRQKRWGFVEEVLKIIANRPKERAARAEQERIDQELIAETRPAAVRLRRLPTDGQQKAAVPMKPR